MVHLYENDIIKYTYFKDEIAWIFLLIIIPMSQKRVATLLRASNRFNTPAFWNSSLTDSSSIFWNDFLIRQFLQLMLLSANCVTFLHNTYTSYYSIHNNITLSLPLNITNFRDSSKHSPVNSSDYPNESGLLVPPKLDNFRVFLQQDTLNFRKLFFNRTFSENTLMVGTPSATVVADFIAMQIKLPNKLKCSSFRRGLQVGISSLCRLLFTKNESAVLVGIRISCFGKWSKTRAGRKQTITLSVGRLNSTSISSPLTYSKSTISTKYGSCSVKVWLNFKSFVA